MIKRLFILCCFTFIFIGLKAQPYRNEWINYSQNYYKIKIAKNGIYRIDSTALSAAGIPLLNLDPHRFQLFNNGVEQTIFIQGDNDGIFNGSDFIEFYAEKNDGKSDSVLYVNSVFVPNPYYSLINDTAIYFLTWNNSTLNKRMVQDASVGSYAPSPYFFKEEIQSYTGAYYEGETDLAGGTDCRYTSSEGYFDSNVLTLSTDLNGGIHDGERKYNLNTSNMYTGGPNARIQIVAVGASKDIGFLSSSPPKPDHHLSIQYKKSDVGVKSLLFDKKFMGYQACKFDTSFATTLLGTTSTDFSFFSIADANFVSNRTAVSYISIKYPHTFDLEGKSTFLMYLPDNPSQLKCFLDISNFAPTGGNVLMYDLTNNLRINVVQNGSNYNAIVPNSGAEKKCYITSDSSIVNIKSLQPVTASAKFTNYSNFATDSAFVIITNKKLMTSATDYKNYRSTNIFGGLHNVVLADIDELYDQFAFGIVKSPLSIKGFADYLLDTYPTKPQNLFLIGKAIHMRLCRQDASNYANCLVPSFGNVSSDNLLTSGLNGTMLEPPIATGRLAAKTDNDVTIYLNKIIEYEDKINNPPAEWKKRVLHFGGGHFDNEQRDFKAYLNNYKDTIENIYYGGQVTEFFKTSSAPIQLNSSTNLKNLINNGVSLMTFFGHASATTGFDQSIDDVNAYNPIPGHYPFLLANGCFVGNIHDVEISSSETYLFAANKGFIGYLGTGGLGVPYALNAYSQEFYNQLARKNYNKSVGSSIQRIITTIQPQSLSDPLIAAVCNEMTLHGDPSLKLNVYDKPDYEIKNDRVFFDFTSDVDSITVYIVRTNLGKETHDSITTELIRTFPNGDIEEYKMSGPAPGFKDTITFKLYVDFSRGVGMNKIKVTLDAFSQVDELSENNNTTDLVNMFVPGVGINPIYPYEFAIIAKDTVTLKASTVDQFAKAKNYFFQFDTTDAFNSPFMKSAVVNAPGGVISWKPPVTFPDSTVYYWRVSPDTVNNKGFHWKESSFQYIKNKTGWEQAHFFQFKNDEYQYVKYNRPQRKFDFANDVKTVQCHNGFYYKEPDWYLIKWKLNNYEETYWHCNETHPSISIGVISPITGELAMESPVISNPAASTNNGSNKECHCRDYVQRTFEFMVDDSLRRSYLIDFINIIPSGSYVIAYSVNQINYTSFETPFYDAFKTLGSSKIDSLRAYSIQTSLRPYILFGKKGASNSATELIGSSPTAKIDLNTTFTTNFDKGTISSPVIGPAKSWGSFHWRQHVTPSDASNSDSVEVQLIGIKGDGSESTLTVFKKNMTDILNLSSYVDAAVYPNIRLVASMKDDALHTPPQMERWQVIFDEIPEGAINPTKGYYISSDTVQEGETVTLHIPFQNVSNTAFPDSLLFTYWSESADGTINTLFNRTKKNLLAPNKVLIDTLNLNTANYLGINALWVEVNQGNHPQSQLEQFHFNNITRIPFEITSDKINPLLDVTYDGIHILNNDIVSAKPTILIKLKDENRFLALNDTNDFQVFIQSPSSALAKRLYFGSEMSFTPAVLPNNSCQIIYKPTLTQDGTYQLIVQAKDKSENLSGAIDYKMSFEVINKSTITEVMNFPNPFSTSTRFVFTITGTEVPTYFKIQILTITGKVIREINQDELGYIHIGRNITEFAWNGKDQFGDQLANGVYLYRVVSSIKGTAIEKRDSGADQYFKKGFGKMYLMR